MKNLTLNLLFSWFCISFSLSALAVEVSDLYKASVEVNAQDLGERSAGFTRALNKVLIKVTGREDLVTGQSLSSLFDPPESYVLTFTYSDNPAFEAYLLEQAKKTVQEQTPDEHDVIIDSQILTTEQSLMDASLVDNTDSDLTSLSTEPPRYLLDVSFSPVVVNSVLARQGVNVWGSSRPLLAMWLVSDEFGVRTLVGEAEINQVLPDLLSYSRERGIPILLPVADLEDQMSVDVNQLWGLFQEGLPANGLRYGHDAQLIMRLSSIPLDEAETNTPSPSPDYVSEKTSERHWQGAWQLVINGEAVPGFSSSTNKDGIVSDMLSSVASELSNRYAVSGDNGLDTSLILEVQGVSTFKAFKDVQQHLTNMAPVSSLGVTKVSGDRVYIELSLLDSIEKLQQYIDLGGLLVRMPESPEEGIRPNFASMRYIWQGR